MRRLFLAAALFLLVGCGDGSPTSPDGPFSRTETGTVAAFGTVRHPLDVPRSGSMQVRLTWQSAAVDLDLYLAPVTCTQLYPQSSCGILGESVAPTGTTQETITRSVVDGDQYQIFIDNLHLTEPQNYTLTVTIN